MRVGSCTCLVSPPGGAGTVQGGGDEEEGQLDWVQSAAALSQPFLLFFVSELTWKVVMEETWRANRTRTRTGGTRADTLLQVGARTTSRLWTRGFRKDEIFLETFGVHGAGIVPTSWDVDPTLIVIDILLIVYWSAGWPRFFCCWHSGPVQMPKARSRRDPPTAFTPADTRARTEPARPADTGKMTRARKVSLMLGCSSPAASVSPFSVIQTSHEHLFLLSLRGGCVWRHWGQVSSDCWGSKVNTRVQQVDTQVCLPRSPLWPLIYVQFVSRQIYHLHGVLHIFSVK